MLLCTQKALHSAYLEEIILRKKKENLYVITCNTDMVILWANLDFQINNQILL